MQFSFEAIGTVWVIDIFDPIKKENTLLEAIQKRIEKFDKTYSRFRSDSLVTNMFHKQGTYKLPHDAKKLLDLYREIYDITAGYVTPLIGNVLIDAGYDAKYSLKPKTLHHPYSWNEALDYSYPALTLKKKVMLDFGAGGKGYLIDVIEKVLATYNIHSFCIDAGGDILYKNKTSKSIRVGLENPMNTKQAIGIANILNQSICGSSGNRRAWGTFHHIINPQTLQSPEHIIATWAIADNALLADMITTCLFFVSPATLLKHYGFEYVVLYRDYSIEKSRNFPGEFFT